MRQRTAPVKDGSQTAAGFIGSLIWTASLLGMMSLAVAGFAAAPLTSSPTTAPQLAFGNAFGGSIFGQVRNTKGVPQMGAGVQLYNRFEELVGRGLTNDQGVFVFAGLAPDVYSVRVFLASFVSAERRRIAVLPSVQNRVNIDLATVLGGMDLGSPAAQPGNTLMSDDWKWVLRTSHATRPVLRLLPYPKDRGTVSSSTRPAAFSHTTGVVKISAGDAGSFAGGAEQDLGTAFAVATSVRGTSRILLSGNVGYSANSPLPAAGIRTSYTSKMADGSSPLLVMTARQIYLAPRAGAGESALALRSLSSAFLDNLQISQRVSVDYGIQLQSVAYAQRTSSVSPFLRANYDAGNWGKLRAAASSGARPGELVARDAQAAGMPGLDQGLAALGMVPIVSRADRQLTLERARSVELGWERAAGSRTYSASVYEELVSNAAFILSNGRGVVPRADLLPDLNSRSDIFNVGSYERRGFIAAVKQTLGSHAEVSLAAGRTGALLTQRVAGNADDSTSQTLRAGIRQAQRPFATVRMAGILPVAKTRVSANYGWTDFHVLMPAHLFVTQGATQDIGVNIYVRQPLPISGLPWHMEATAEMRNLLAQGYLPIGAASHGILTNSPRAVRGGLNFVF